MFKSDHHKKVITILKSLRSNFFNEISAYFGGGTLLTLLYGEYRRSKDIDFTEPDYRNNCFSSLQVQNRAKIIDGLDLLASDFGISSTKRKDDEYPDF
ncbi:MAG: nucleotidyl transferase AbiEii/AbiGii toxin family protein [Desulfobacterales bacterium]|nr:nucleotidyl transferase AbiEii/AbiGii toxin family protein [Desulfobacterales bacterium]